MNVLKKERQVNGNEKDTEYDSYVNFVQSELMNNKYFKDKNLGNVLQSGIKIYTNMDKDVQKRFKIVLIMVVLTTIKMMTNKSVQLS